MLTTSLHQFLLFAHIIAFAFAFVAVVRADLALLSAERIDPEWPHAVARPILLLLGVLWLTGAALIWMQYGLDPGAVAARPKLLAKLAVVVLLTCNGLLLHTIAFPLLTRPTRRPRMAATVSSVLGAVSSATWLYASFVGTARVIGPTLSFAGFMLLYAGCLGVALVIALTLVRPRIERLIAAPAVAVPDVDALPTGLMSGAPADAAMRPAA
ncbi:MAG: hypothetical protein JSR59_07010 [Proteobacteria bacterium]|nr:hypothetical protein [Pseudomonadota bacterium]